MARPASKALVTTAEVCSLKNLTSQKVIVTFVHPLEGFQSLTLLPKQTITTSFNGRELKELLSVFLSKNNNILAIL